MTSLLSCFTAFTYCFLILHDFTAFTYCFHILHDFTAFTYCFHTSWLHCFQFDCFHLYVTYHHLFTSNIAWLNGLSGTSRAVADACVTCRRDYTWLFDSFEHGLRWRNCSLRFDHIIIIPSETNLRRRTNSFRQNVRKEDNSIKWFWKYWNKYTKQQNNNNIITNHTTFLLHLYWFSTELPWCQTPGPSFKHSHVYFG